MNKPEISVIVPVYNVEKYLRQCLDSILDQTFKNIEIICVNDGTTDNSGEILAEYKKRDSRIKIVDKENGGLSSARNAGLKVASGEFVSFIDSDDWVDKTMLEKLYKSMITLDTDITICAVHQFDESKQKIDDSNPYYTLGYFNDSFDNRAFTYKDVKPFIMDVCVMAWNKLYRKSHIDACRAEFPDGLIWEDGPFFFSIFFKAKQVSIVRDFLYYYRINRKGSIVQKGGKQFLDIIPVIELMYNHIRFLPDYEDIKYNFFRKKVEDIISRFENLDSKYRYKFAQLVWDKCSLGKEKLFPPEMVRGAFRYNYYLFSNLKTGNITYYNWRKFVMRFKYKVMEIMYLNENHFSFKYKTTVIKIKKHPKIFDIYYSNDKLHACILTKIKFKIPFKFSELEKFNEND